jgi:ABC-type nitrate/sulfonate/bicarbonate transport system permease component
VNWLARDSRPAATVRLIIALAIIVAVWEAMTRTVITNRLILVPPDDVFAALVTDFSNGSLAKNSAVTLWELVVSFPVAVVAGVAIGVVLAGNRVVASTAEPLLTALNAVPIVALAPLFIAWLGLGFASKFAVIILVSLFSVIISTEVGLRSAPAEFIEAARSFNASSWQIFTTVTLPFAIPFIVGGVRVAFARALVGVIVAEFFGSLAGYGNAILAAGQQFNTANLLAYVVVLGALGLVGSILLRTLETRLAPWREVART